MPLHPEHLPVPFRCSNSSSHWLSKGCQTAVVRGGEAVKLVLLLSQGRRRKLSSEANWVLYRENRVVYKPQWLQQQDPLFVGLCKQEVSVNA